jgi:hypothetical protein
MPGATATPKSRKYYIKLTMPGPLKPLFSRLPDSPTCPGRRPERLDGLEKLARRSSEAALLTDRVRAALPARVAGHVIGAARRGTDLVVIVDSSAWSARVRYAGRRIREALAEAGETDIERVRVRVAAP